VKFLVVEQSAYPCLIGVTWMYDHSAVFDCKSYFSFEEKGKRQTVPLSVEPGVAGDPWQTKFRSRDAKLPLNLNYVTVLDPDGDVEVETETGEVMSASILDLENVPEVLVLNHVGEAKFLSGIDVENYPTPDLDDGQRTQLKELLLEFKHLFPSNMQEKGTFKSDEFEIKIKEGCSLPEFQRPFRLPQSQLVAMKKLLDEYVQANVIRPAKDPKTAARAFFIPKPDGSLRMIVDYRKLNAVTETVKMVMPIIDELIESLSGSEWFSVFDMMSGYWQMVVAKGSIPLTAFSTVFGIFEYLVVPLGLKNAPAKFQQFVTKSFADFIPKFMKIFMDDGCCHTKTWDEHIVALRQIFVKCSELNIGLQLKKCFFGRRKVKLLGHTVSGKGIEPDPAVCVIFTGSL